MNFIKGIKLLELIHILSIDTDVRIFVHYSSLDKPFAIYEGQMEDVYTEIDCKEVEVLSYKIEFMYVCYERLFIKVVEDER